MIVLLVLTLSAPVDCDQIRAKVAELGKMKAYAMAIAHGYTHQEISRIRKQCGV